MAAEAGDRCAICLDSWTSPAHAMPCLHTFCYPCLRHWARQKPECPLCRRRVTSILHSAPARDSSQGQASAPEMPPVVPPAAGGAQGHPDTPNRRPHIALLPLPRRVVPSAPASTSHPRLWAFPSQQDPDLLRPLLPWLQRELQPILEGSHREMLQAHRHVLPSLRRFGPDRDILILPLEDGPGQPPSSFLGRLMDTIRARRRREPGRRGAVGTARAAPGHHNRPTAVPSPAATRAPSPAASRLPSSAPTALRGGPASPQQEEQQQEPQGAGEGPSSASAGSQRSPRQPQRAHKRKASSSEASSPPNKKPPGRQ